MSKTSDKVSTVAKKSVQAVKDYPMKTAYVLIGMVGFFAVYQVGKKVYNALTHADVDDNVNNTGGSTIGNTISNQQATNFAQQLLDAMNLNRNSILLGGTDEDTIEAVFDQLQNGADFNKVFDAFGMKSYNGENSPNESVVGFLDTYEDRNLVYWLNSEISSIWDSSLRRKIKAIVEDAGFTF